MDYRPLPIGISDFADMIRLKYYYVDKTPMIRDLLDNQASVTLFTRPRRFGKTLNMSMLKYFFRMTGTGKEINGTGLIFSRGLRSWRPGKNMGQYPVIYLTFKDSRRKLPEILYGDGQGDLRRVCAA